MSEEIIVSKELNREDRYKSLLPQIESLIAGESDLVANLANIAAALKEAMAFFWVGFYLVKEGELVLGPFQGPVACTILFGKGVCGTSWKEKKVVLVPDVDKFPGHIACSSASRSEIVLPIFHKGEVKMILDVDSEHLDYFDHVDKKHLQVLTHIIENCIK